MNYLNSVLDMAMTCLRSAWAAAGRAVAKSFSQMTLGTTVLTFAAFLFGCAVGFLVGSYRSIQTALDISQADVKQRRRLRGLVVAVADGDTIRIRHRPLWACVRPPPKGYTRADHSISIRVGAVDTPEISHQGRPAQPFGKEAMDFTKEQVKDRPVLVKFLARDQYGRLVASVEYGSLWRRKSLSEELLKQGLACVYRQSGAEDGYDGKQEVYDKLEKKAMRSKKGMWSQGKDLVLPSEYKA